MTPIFGSPKKQNTKISVSGVLRKMLTYTTPTARTTGTGETRIAASSVPPTMHSTAVTTARLIVVVNASTNRSVLSSSVSKNMAAAVSRARRSEPGRVGQLQVSVSGWVAVAPLLPNVAS